MSKGSTRRPQQISEAEMQRRWDIAFGKICPECEDPLYDGECKNIDCGAYWRAAEKFWLEAAEERPDLFDKNETSESKKA